MDGLDELFRAEEELDHLKKHLAALVEEMRRGPYVTPEDERVSNYWADELERLIRGTYTIRERLAMKKKKIMCEWCGSNKIFPIHAVFSWITRKEFSGITMREDYRSKYKNPQMWLGGDSFACYFGCLDCDDVTEVLVAGDSKAEEVDYCVGVIKLKAKNQEFIDFLKAESRMIKSGERRGAW